MYLKNLFVIIAVILFLLLSFYKLYICKKPRTEKISGFVSFIAAMILLYVINAVILGIFISGTVNKIAFLCFAISPFVIGRAATYEKEGWYSFIQIVFVVVSIIYTVIV